MSDNKQDTTSIRDILKDVDSAVATEQTARKKKRKRVIFIAIVCAAVVAVLIGRALNKYNQERQFRENLLETAISVTSEYGVDDLTVVSARSDVYKVTFQSDTFKDLSNHDKMDVFRGFTKLTGAYSWFLSCKNEDSVVIISDGIRYTAKINEYGASYYRYLYADGNEILRDTYTDSFSSSSSSRGTGTCSGGSVGCRVGFHPCHEMSNGYCNMCCKDS